MSQSKQYVGLDVSLKETSICVIDDADKIVWRGQVDSTPEAIASAVKQHAPHAVRIGLESGQLSSWLSLLGRASTTARFFLRRSLVECVRDIAASKP
jgi:hypothetical protein